MYPNNREIGLRSSIFLRVIITTVLIGSGAIVYFGNGSRTEAFYLAVLVAVVYLISLVYLVLQPVFRTRTQLFKAVQIFLDILIASAAIYITGGRSSPFIFLYVLIIIYAGVVLSKTASYITAGFSGLFYILIVLLQLKFNLVIGADQAAVTESVWRERGVVSTYFHLTGFILIALLGGYLSERIKVAGKELGESERSLRRLQNLHENILQSLTSGVITLDLEGQIISVNKMGLDILGIDTEYEVLGKELGTLMPGVRAEEFMTKSREQMLYSRPDGEKLTLGFSSSILKDTEDVNLGFIIIFQDLTEVKHLENRLRTSEKMALLGQLAAGLAHELRNPLSAISGAVEVLSTDADTNDQNKRLVKVATQEVERVNLLVEDFLILTMPLQKLTSSVDLGLILDETINSFRRSMLRKNIELTSDIKHGVYVQGDSYRLKQAAWNLLLNSRDALPNGGHIDVSSKLENGNVIVEITDDGFGIDESVISRIFDPFFTTKEVGTGLGLAIVQKVIEGYNGKINLTSKEEKGTTVVITLPIVDVTNEMVAH